MTQPVLTPQQRRVLEYVAEGLTHTPRYTPTNDELAVRMGLSPSTVSIHLSAAYDKLRDHCAPDRAAAAHAAAALGLIHAPRLIHPPTRRRHVKAQAETLELVP